MQIEMWDIEKVKEYEGNPREISDQAVAAVAASIREFGFKVSVIVDKDCVLIAGHTRARAPRKVGLSEVPVTLPAADRRGEDCMPILERIRWLRPPEPVPG